MMHHLLQHFRNNWWHLVQTVKEEPAEDRPLSTVPSVGSTSREQSSGASYPAPVGTTFDHEFGAHGEISNILDGAGHSGHQLQETGQENSRLSPLLSPRPHCCA